ncbi:MAG: TraR/DksA C4-type zinc finger protein [Brevundimonas sp.]|uniref:TraR/DksA C4-type zinc finger protein n=1 Tax=Brevundimonas sp. TaxID=1871086 RepID=UPI001A18DC65|nr:TraR/DksA C4-type zinc finger protein [Brevundimonas sp.]MBJ7318252.1 TraR/DksA C4-type zinc finger protein [Brevundimonas sp.]
MTGDFGDQAEAIEAMQRRLALEAVQERADAMRSAAAAGGCEDCGDDIPVDRRTAVPGARRCVFCEGARERQGRR